MPKPMSNFFKSVFKPGTHPPAVSIRRDCYTMSMTDGLDAEIQFYGEIVRTRPVDWWTGEPIPGDFIMLDEFLEDLKAVAGAKTLLMRIDSVGGNSEVSIVIHNRLRELPAKKTARVDGVAMSGGTHIMCAADIIQVNPASQVMIHKCWTYFWGAYNADELRQEADQLDPTDKSQVAIYKARTGKTEEELLAMMSKTTTMVGQEIIDAGFADEMLDAAEEKPEIAASADGRHLFVNGRTLSMAPFAKLPENIKVVKTAKADQTNTKQPAKTGGQEGGPLMAKNLEELRAEDPELANQLVAEAQAAASKDAGAAVNAERQRIADIDAIAALYDNETVQEAKYGENACTAQEMAFHAAQKAAKNGTAFMAAANKDYQASGAANVGAATPEADDPTGDKTPGQRMAEARAGVKSLLSSKEEK
ncbi:MAG TPA: head maturation protease, ClpP-related [Clostridia bacterium]|nr:head maturation protease, ClpP-related [Clostridia bacterium]